jgi:DNA ligase (NAD+)
LGNLGFTGKTELVTDPHRQRMMVRESTNTDNHLPRVKHRTPMLPFDEGISEGEILAFDRRVREQLGKTRPLQFTVEPKIQGVAVEIAYAGGVLSLASTAGTGYEGEDVTANIKTILTVPLTLWRIGDAPPFPEYLEVRGDVYMETALFEELNRERKGKGLPQFKDAKDAAESLIKVNPRITAKTPLNMFCHGMGEVQGAFPRTSYEMMVILQSWGFRVNRPHIRIYETPDELLAGCRAVREECREWPFLTEGALIQVNNLDLRERIGKDRGWAFVYRF